MEHLLAERVKEIMEELEYSSTGFADTIDVPRPILSHILSGRNKPSLDVIQKILMRFPELNPWWLLTGKGTMKQLSLFEEVEDIVPKRQTTQNYASSSPVATATSKTEFKADATRDNSTIAAENLAPPVAPKAEVQQTVVEASPAKASSPPTNVQEVVAQTGDKKIEKMIVFYTDKTFSIYHPE